MHRNQSVSTHQFSMVPRAEIPRSSFNMQTTHKTTFDAGYLIPVLCEEVLPGDTFNVKMTAFARLATPIFPIMDNLYLESFFFYVPNRQLWTNWERFMGQQDNPGDSTSFLVPYVASAAGGFLPNSIYDYFGLPTVGQVQAGGLVNGNALPFRAYLKIWNEWFRDENLQQAAPVPMGDGPDTAAQYYLLRRSKRHDYFTSCLPWPQKGQSVSMPIGTSAPVLTNNQPVTFSGGGATNGNLQVNAISSELGALQLVGANVDDTTILFGNQSGLFADLSAATAATINQLRQAFQIQKLLERDARGGTRYTEIIRAHFGVVSPDARLQRSEYLGGGSAPIVINPIAQTSGTGLTGGTTPLGNLAAIGTATAHGHGFRQSFTEHGYIIGLVMVRADLTYQQGLRRHWSRRTRYDYYFPAFAMLGEQAVTLGEIFSRGIAADGDVWGYQERWAEYRYSPGRVSGLFKSTTAGTIDGWHLAQHFTSAPNLGTTFIQETPPIQRIVAVGAAAGGAQFIFDSFFDMKVARPLPMYSVPGMIDHF